MLIIDDTAGIHEDFRKILLPEESLELDQAQAALFGPRPGAPPPRKFQIDSAYQGQEALDLVNRAVQQGRPYALAFVDIRMPPGWDGLETARRLWKVDPNLQIVICTAYSDYSWRDMTEKLGQTDSLVFLKKPFENTEILQLVYALTAKSTLAIQNRLRIEELDGLVAQRTQELQAANAELTADIAARKEIESRLVVFSTLGRRLSEAQDARAAAEIIAEAAGQLVGWEACLCHLLSPEKEDLLELVSKKIRLGFGLGAEEEQAIVELAKKTIKDGAQLAQPGSEKPASKNSGISLMCAPVRNGDSVIGVLSVQKHQPSAYDLRSLETLQALADHCGGVLNRLKSEEILRQTEEQLRHSQKMEAVGLLAGGVAHDFNNLLAVILGNAELALEEAMMPAVNDVGCLKEIVEAADRASNLTRQLLTFSRKQLISPKPLDLNQVISNLSRMLKRIIGQNIELRLNYDENLPLIQADAGLLDQVIMNLVVNSRDAMPRGGELVLATEIVVLSEPIASHHPEARPGRFICLTVADTGTGITPEHLARIFEPFFTTKARDKGTGLGLSTVFGIVKQHEGWLEVNSEVGVGTTFEIFLPALDPGDATSPLAQNHAKPKGGAEVILLVEDETTVRKVSRRFLEDAGYRVLEAASGREALEVWTRHAQTIELLLTDIQMPGGINGWDLAEQLTAAKPGLKVVFMSGFAGDVPSENLKSITGIRRRFIEKPCLRNELLGAVREFLDDQIEPPGKSLPERITSDL